MICYKLRCENDHGFEGWFQNSTSYAHQVETGLVTCPECGSAHVEKALMAPAVTTSRGDVATVHAPGTSPVASNPSAVQATIPSADRARVALRQLQNLVKQHFEDVGPRFADEAIARYRKVEAGEAVSQGIYGQATPEDRARLEDEGIDFLTLPWELKDDA